MNVTEKEVMIKGVVSIGATVTCADESKKNPAVVIIMGTGKTDRDGNSKGFQTDLYKNLAQMFAELGFAVVRYDKRGTFKTEGDFNSTGLNELVDDAAAVIRYTKSLPYVDEAAVMICGHSEGAIIATLLTKIEDIAGLMLFGGAGSCLKDALYYQNRLAANEFGKKKGLLGAILRKAFSVEKAYAKLDAMFKKCSETEKVKIFYGGSILNAKYWREHDAYTSEELVKLLKEYGKPVLAITGTADLSADFKQLDPLKNISNIECYSPENVNHILREIDDDNSMMTAKDQYLRLSKQPVHAGTKKKICEWMKAFAAVHGEGSIAL